MTVCFSNLRGNGNLTAHTLNYPYFDFIDLNIFIPKATFVERESGSQMYRFKNFLFLIIFYSAFLTEAILSRDLLMEYLGLKRFGWREAT